MSPNLKTLGAALLVAGVLSNKTLSAQTSAVTTAEAEKLSTRLELSINSGDPEILNNLIYFPEFINRTQSNSAIINNVDTLTKIATAFGLFQIGNSTLETSKNGSYSLVRGFKKNEEMHLLFRAYGNGGLNYQDIILIKIKDSVRAADIFSYQLGESYARLFSYLITDMATPDAHASMTSREKYGDIFEHALAVKNYSVARSAFEKFDDATQNDKHFSLEYMQVCSQLGDKLFRKSLDHYLSIYPEEPTPYLLMMNKYADTKNFADYSHAIDQLDTLLHIDPFLDYLRGNVEEKLGDARGALHFYQAVFDYDPAIWQNTEKLVALKVVNNELVQANDAINLYSHTPGYRKDLVEALYKSYPVLK